MANNNGADYYEVLQVSPNADLDTIHRVYRLLAQRFHPDNRESGNEGDGGVDSRSRHGLNVATPSLKPKFRPIRCLS